MAGCGHNGDMPMSLHQAKIMILCDICKKYQDNRQGEREKASSASLTHSLKAHPHAMACKPPAHGWPIIML